MKRAIVTGASSGIGRATALALARHGYDLGITYRSGHDAALEVAAEIERLGRVCRAVRVDFAEPRAAAVVVAGLAEELGGVDALVNNAAVSPTATFLDETAEGLASTLSINLVAPFLCAQAVAPAMAAAGRGVIVNITSVLDTAPLAGKASYCASKAGLAGATRVMALELARHGIRVLAVAPGHTATPMNFGDTSDPAPRLPVVPLGRAGRVDELAETIAFAVGDGAGYMTGTTLLVDGGMLLVTGAQLLEEEAEHLDGPSYRDAGR